MRFVVAVPARLESSRLPGKVLADIGGKPMIQRVLERCALAHRPVAVVLCTDNDDLMRAAESWGFPALATSPACDSGSQRTLQYVSRTTVLIPLS
jgi:3-deoxy-manno-octulosonate cytidylyltransferase (CMP-KDO synthetase)